MATLPVVGLDTAFAKDPAITLRDYIKDNYTITHPKKDSVVFDTKFARGDKYNYVIIENVKKPITHQTLGSSRFRYDDFKKVQIWCGKSDAKNKAFLIAEHIENIINANPLGMQSDGIHRAFIEDFQEVPTQPLPSNVGEIEVVSTNVYRLAANVKIVYYKYLL